MPESPKPGKIAASKARRYKRFGFDRRVVVFRNDDTQSQLRGRCDTVGEGGIGVMLAGELELGEQVNVELTLDGDSGPADALDYGSQRLTRASRTAARGGPAVPTSYSGGRRSGSSDSTACWYSVFCGRKNRAVS